MWKLFTSGEVSLTRRLKVTPNLGNEYPRRMLDLRIVVKKQREDFLQPTHMAGERGLQYLHTFGLPWPKCRENWRT